HKLAIFLYFLFFILFGVLIFFLTSFLIGLIAQLTTKIPDLIGTTPIMDTIIARLENITGRLGSLFDKGTVATIEDALKNLQSSAVESLPQLLTKVLNFLTGFFSSLPRIILIFVVTIMSGYYFIIQSDRLYLLLLRLIPDKEFVGKIFTASSNLTSSLLRIGGGYIVLLFLTFAQAYAGMLILSIPNALLWAAVCAVVDILPILGISITLIPMGIVLIVSGDIFAGVGIFILYIIMLVLRRFIEPVLIGNAMRLHPMTMVLAMIAGIAVLGLGGVLVGPFILVVMLEIYNTFGLEEKVRNTIGDLLHRNGSEENVSEAESGSSTEKDEKPSIT
ncbi:MAG: AI-2E family transporter, partial [Fastidiosipila sp.]|nr:AI-2E family transporter [Fastidiosipila sp.]